MAPSGSSWHPLAHDMHTNNNNEKIKQFFKRYSERASKMAQLIKSPAAAMPGNLSLIPGTYMVEGEN